MILEKDLKLFMVFWGLIFIILQRKCLKYGHIKINRLLIYKTEHENTNKINI